MFEDILNIDVESESYWDDGDFCKVVFVVVFSCVRNVKFCENVC